MLFRSMTGIEMSHVPYKGGVPAATDLIAGQIHVMFLNVPAAVPYVKADKVRAMGISTAKRSPHLPQVPSIHEAGVPGFDDPQKRVLAATVDGVRVVCLYVPNGQSVDSDKYRYKLDWLQRVTVWLRSELAANGKLVVVGDFNIAPDERDVHDPKACEGQVLCSEPERTAFRELIALGLADSFRLFEQPPQSFSWWDYRMNAFRRKLGLRIDHILLSQALAKTCTSCIIDVEPRKLERPSDHAPVMADV